MTKLGFGFMRLPMKNDVIDIETTNKMVDMYIERGFTYFDTAWGYCKHTSENAIKTCVVDRYPREAFTITTKLPPFHLTCIEDRDTIFNKQKEKTGCDYFDYYLLHEVSSDSLPIFDKYDCWNWLIDKKEKGEVKHIGFSFHDKADFLEDVLKKHPQIEFVQIQLNYLDFESIAVESRKCYEVCRKYNKQVLIMEPVKGGTLADVPKEVENLFKSADPNLSIPSWAIRFAASLDGVFKVLSGMSTIEQVDDNTSYMQNFKALNQDEMNLCLKAAEIINKDITIPCTGCSYCTENCPIGMPIPKFFSLYNAEKKEKGDDWNSDWTACQELYAHLITGCGVGAKDCLQCGECEKQCPQNIKIRDFLNEIGEYWGK